MAMEINRIFLVLNMAKSTISNISYFRIEMAKEKVVNGLDSNATMKEAL